MRFGTLAFVDPNVPATEWARAMLRHMDYLACSGSFIAVDSTLAGLLVFSDKVRRETPQTLRRLRNRGIEKNVMLTGDRLETAEMIALSAGIDELGAGLTPEDKVRAVQQGSLHSSTLMVGDGINDAPALAAANVGVAMGVGSATASSQAAGGGCWSIGWIGWWRRWTSPGEPATSRAGRYGPVIAGHGGGRLRLPAAADGGGGAGEASTSSSTPWGRHGHCTSNRSVLTILIACKTNTSSSQVC